MDWEGTAEATPSVTIRTEVGSRLFEVEGSPATTNDIDPGRMQDKTGSNDKREPLKEIELNHRSNQERCPRHHRMQVERAGQTEKHLLIEFKNNASTNGDEWIRPIGDADTSLEIKIETGRERAIENTNRFKIKRLMHSTAVEMGLFDDRKTSSERPRRVTVVLFGGKRWNRKTHNGHEHDERTHGAPLPLSEGDKG